MTIVTIAFVLWTITSILSGIVLRMPYDVFEQDKFWSSIVGFFLGPVVWCLIIVYWIMFTKDMIIYSFKRQ